MTPFGVGTAGFIQLVHITACDRCRTQLKKWPTSKRAEGREGRKGRGRKFPFPKVKVSRNKHRWRRRLVLVFQYNVLSDRFMIQSRDVIGWTNEEEYSLISFNFADNHLTRFYSFEADVFPAINKTIILDGVVYPGVFSVAVEIRPGSPPTGAPNAGW